MIIKSNFMPPELYSKFIGDDPWFKNKPISIFNDYTPSIEELNINPYNILVILELNQLFGLHDWTIKYSNHFSCILTWSSQILEKCSNSVLLPFGTTFLHSNNKYRELANTEKNFEITYLCGVKDNLEGQKLRQKIYSKQDQVFIPKKWYYTIEGSKDICFGNNMFHIAIENSQNQNYFTEKIIDSFITKTVPVYWGCPNIGDFFDQRGFIIFNTEEEFFNIINSLTEKDYYIRKKYIEINYQLAIYYAEYFMRFKALLREIIELNNI